MQGAGFTGFIRGERGSTAENLTSLEYKIKQDQKRLAELSEQIYNEQVRYDDNHNAFMTFAEIDESGKKTITGKFTVSAEDYKKLTTLAKRSYSAVSEAKKLQEENQSLLLQLIIHVPDDLIGFGAADTHDLSHFGSGDKLRFHLCFHCTSC